MKPNSRTNVALFAVLTLTAAGLTTGFDCQEPADEQPGEADGQLAEETGDSTSGDDGDEPSGHVATPELSIPEDDIDIEGPIDEQEVHQAISDHRSDFSRCLHGREGDGEIATADVRWTIDAEANVVDTTIEDATDDESGLEFCIDHFSSDITFPEPDDNREVTVEYRFEYDIVVE